MKIKLYQIILKFKKEIPIPITPDKSKTAFKYAKSYFQKYFFSIDNSFFISKKLAVLSGFLMAFNSPSR